MRISRLELEEMIVYEDEDVLVCHKCPYIAVESANVRQQDMVSLLRNRRLAKREEPYLGVIHRIDQPVEGLLVFAKNKNAAASLSKQLKEGDLSKDYLAIVEKKDEKLLSGELTHYLKKNEKENRSRVVDHDTPGAKRAHLSYEVLGETGQGYMLAVHLDTGRHHQIRVQFSAIGHPLLGDEKYGARAIGGQSLALCANHLAFVHPTTGKKLEFQVKPKSDLWMRAGMSDKDM